ncbi:hypothetical protein [Propionivibrio sp.]|uniref:hypothetical protein n=1 Tax=Propionivibrio sp. TaxID=2212460 RepID=UPI003BF1664B
MPHQNRVDPLGQLHAVSAKGAFLGNRGILHNDQQEIVAQWRSKAWITCQLEFKGREIRVKGEESRVFAQDSYSELFFLDEATAFSAGHRPCAECRRDRFNEFKAAWIESNREILLAENPAIAEIDKIIHAERVAEGKRKRTYDAQAGSLPAGTIIEAEGKALLVWRGKLLPWSFVGYGRSQALVSPSTLVQVLSPASVVRVFAPGFTPQVHVSAYS